VLPSTPIDHAQFTGKVTSKVLKLFNSLNAIKSKSLRFTINSFKKIATI